MVKKIYYDNIEVSSSKFIIQIIQIILEFVGAEENQNHPEL